VEIEAEGLPPHALSESIDQAFEAVECVARLMSFHDPESELSRLNRRAALEPVHVHPWTAQVLGWALTLFRETEGLFDCTVGAELVDWELLPDHSYESPARGGLAALRILPGDAISYAENLVIDLGGIAKGFAVDRAIDCLERSGAKGALVNAGGDLRVFGEQAQPIFIRDADNPSALTPAGLLRDGAIASSSAAATLKLCQGRRVSALVSPLTREPLTGRETYSVIAGTCVVADGLTKVLAQTGQTDALYMKRLGATGLVTAPSADRRAA
jgi:thiamine biosynthesis lipoprotein